MESNPRIWIGVLRYSHDHLVERVRDLDISALTQPSACTEWSVAQVMGHLGSQAEIFSVLLRAGLSGSSAPGNEAFPPIWDAWNARSPEAQTRDSIDTNEAFVQSIESLDDKSLSTFHVAAFGMEIDAATLFRLRLSEHAIHSWDIAVAFEPTATIVPDAVDLIIDPALETASRVGKGTARPSMVRIQTHDPERDLALSTNDARIERWSKRQSNVTLQISGEALIRLIYGRFRDADVPNVRLSGNALSLDELRAIFPEV